MGWGDDIMARADAWHQYLDTGRPQQILLDGRPQQWSELWDHSWWIDQQGGQPLNHRQQGQRPYVSDRRWRIKTAPLTWSQQEQARVESRRQIGYWLICPDVKVNQHYKVKDWGWRNWQQLVNELAATKKLLRPRPPWQDRDLAGTETVKAESLRDLWIWVTAAELVITTEGLVHHLRAQTQQPCVTLFGSATSPDPCPDHQGTGYPEQLSIQAQGHRQCYPQTHCDLCEQAWGEITPDRVLAKILRYHHA